MKISKTSLAILLPALLALAVPASAQFTYPGCDTVKASDFRVDTLVRGTGADALTKEPLKMAFSTDAQGNVDVYFVQRHGMVRKYSGATRTTATIANLNFSSGTSLTDSTQIYAGSPASSEGLMGIALDPNFKTNGWVYLYTTLKTVWRVQRYKLTGGALDMASAKTVYRFTHPSFSQHMGGAIRFDGEGNFWITVSDNGSTPSGSSPTTWPEAPDLRYLSSKTNSQFGKILRIRLIAFGEDQNPVPGPGTTYTIPAGNLRNRFLEIGGRASQDTNKILPEIYVMGTRNAYTLAIDSVRKGIAWGDVGPDQFGNNSTNPSQMSEEYNFTTRPGNFGYPYWVGNNNGGITLTNAPLPSGSTLAAPIATFSSASVSHNGIDTLPPARGSIIAYGKACAVTGPVYYYDPGLASAVKFPPHFHGAWFVGDFNNNWIDAVALSAAGDSVKARKKLFSGGTGNTAALMRVPFIPGSNGLLEMEMGPDGALYVLNYSGYRSTTPTSGILRIAYTGSCRPAVLPVAFGRDLRAPSIRLSGGRVNISSGGPHRAEIRDLSGRLVWSRQGRGPAVYDLHEASGFGLGLLTVTVPGERFSRKLFR
jgi:cytochrome c